MKTVILATAVTALMSVLLLPATAAPAKLPSKFVGDWCPARGQTSTYTRGRGVCFESDNYLTVHAKGYEAHEQSCTLLSAVSKKAGTTYLAKFKCHIEGDTSTLSHRMSLDNKGRLVMR